MRAPMPSRVSKAAWRVRRRLKRKHELVEVMLEVLAVGYLASGKLALLLAVPPGYASPIFPPAGISVAAMLIGGPADFALDLSWFIPAQPVDRLFRWSWVGRTLVDCRSRHRLSIDAAGRNGGTTLRHAVEEAEVGPKLTKAACLSWSLNLTRLPPPSRRKVDIAAALEKARAKRAERAELKADWVVEELRKIGFANMADYMKSTSGLMSAARA